MKTFPVNAMIVLVVLLIAGCSTRTYTVGELKAMPDNYGVATKIALESP
jgi:PBP1b-binding outer membrane lipoprotein LpoB